MDLNAWQIAALVFIIGAIISFLVALMIKGLGMILRLVDRKSHGSR